MNKLWSAEEVEFLKKLYEIDGLSVTELHPLFNKKFNRPIDGLKVKIGRLKLRHTKNQISKIKSRLNSGELNGMHGKKSTLKGLTSLTSDMIKNRSKKTSKKRKEMFKSGELNMSGSNNPMFGVASWNKGKTKTDDVRILNYGLKVSKKKKLEWTKKSDEEKIKIIKRINDAMLKVKKPTSIEIKVKKFLLDSGINFKTNFPMNNFRVDFYLQDYNIVIECDGDYWHANPEFFKDELNAIQLKNKDRDIRKEKMLNDNNVKYIRFWENEIKNNFKRVQETILEKISES